MTYGSAPTARPQVVFLPHVVANGQHREDTEYVDFMRASGPVNAALTSG